MTLDKELELDSKRFLDDIDRSSIEGFACTIEELACADMIVRFEQEYDKGMGNQLLQNYIEKVNMKLDSKLRDLNEKSGFTMEQVYGELIFWRRAYSDIVNYYTAYEWSIKLSIVDRADPVSYPYFLAGIWDEDLVDKLVEDGIDPMIALSLYGGLDA